MSLTCKLLKFLPVSMEPGFGKLFYATARSYYIMTLSSLSVCIISPKSESLWKRFVLKDPHPAFLLYRDSPIRMCRKLIASVTVYSWSIVYMSLWKESLNSDGQQFHQYYHLSPLLTEHKNTTTFKVGNPIGTDKQIWLSLFVT